MCNPLHKRVVVVAPLSLLTTCSDDSKPYMILKGRDRIMRATSDKNHEGLLLSEQVVRNSSRRRPAMFVRLCGILGVKGLRVAYKK